MVLQSEPTKKTCSKISVALSIWPRMTIISLSINSLNSRRLHVMCISSSVRIYVTHPARETHRYGLKTANLNLKGRIIFFFANTLTQTASFKNVNEECICSEHLEYWLTSLQVTFSRSFCIMISFKLVLICRSVSSLSVGLQNHHDIEIQCIN